MKKARARRIFTAAALTGALTLASAGNVAAGTDDDDDDDEGDGNPTVVNTGDGFDASDSALPLTFAALGMVGLAGGAYAVRRRQTEV